MQNSHETAISTAVDITGNITRAGFTIITSDDLVIAPDIRASLKLLADSYDALPADPYMPDGGSYRYRRHSRYACHTGTGEVRVAENPGYYQSPENNSFVGGQIRKFEELENLVREGSFMRALIAFNVNQLPMKHVEWWAVQAHCVRIVAREGTAGKPTPEGIHRDGYTFISLHMINRHNIAGGATGIYTPAQNLITETVLTDCLDSLYAEDSRIRHGVGDVHIADPTAGSGVRDMLLMSYDPMSR